MNYPTDSTAKLCQGGKGRYVGREGVPVDNCSREKCEPVIVFESLDLSVCLFFDLHRGRLSLHRGHPVNVPIPRTMHLSSVIPAN